MAGRAGLVTFERLQIPVVNKAPLFQEAPASTLILEVMEQVSKGNGSGATKFVLEKTLSTQME
tara:strand:+ start:179 stop:367 length:189 start_codon:yes stop_codon:yes gene_type:complete